MQEYEAVIGLEVHAELATQSKMFCACPVVDPTQSEPNRAVCPVCAGMPGVLPVVNQQAVEYALRVGLALGCDIPRTSIFARKNYFYPDLPKGYQISQYEHPLAVNGNLVIPLPGLSESGEPSLLKVRIRRAHLEEDTGKLTHVSNEKESYSLVDLNRAGVALLEIVSEPDMHSAEEARAYASALRDVLVYLGVNSGDMEKGVIRFEANVSVRLAGRLELNTRVEIKNLNSFRGMERAVNYEIERQIGLMRKGERVQQETVGWDDLNGVTFTQRSKEEAHDYRYFPEPDLPPLVVDVEWVEQVRSGLPELPYARFQRFQAQYGLNAYDAGVLTAEQSVANYFEQAAAAGADLPPKVIANWLLGDLFGLMKQKGMGTADLKISPAALAELIRLLAAGKVNPSTAKTVLAEMAESGESAGAIINRRGLGMVSDTQAIAALVDKVLSASPQEVASYLAGKETLSQWFFGQVMRAAGGQANPKVVREELARRLAAMKP